MRKLIAVLFAVALIFGLIAFSSQLPSLPSLGDIMGNSENTPPPDDTWPEDFAAFPQYQEGGSLVSTSLGSTVMFRIYEDTSLENVQAYLARLEENGFTREGETARLVQDGLLYRFDYDRNSESKYQLNFTIEEAPPAPPLETLQARWTGPVARYATQYNGRLVAEANEAGLVHTVYITAECQDEWDAQALLAVLQEEYENTQQQDTVVTAEWHSEEGLTFEQIRARFNSFGGYSEEILTREPQEA